MRERILTVTENLRLNADTYKMTLSGDVGDLKAGQFVELKIDGFYLRRPFGAADSSKDSLTVLYKEAGRGTNRMTEYKIGEKINALLELGNGFSPEKSKKPLLIGGGIGLAPLYKLAKEFNEKGIRPVIIAGFKNKDEAFYLDEFKALGELIVSTDLGCLGYKGNAVSCLKETAPEFDYYYACGPLVMLKALAAYSKNGQISLDARMGCGFGACMGCSVRTVNGAKRVCKEGPVFEATEVIFDD